MKKDKFLEKVHISKVDLIETPLLSKPHEGDVILCLERSKQESNSIECFIHGDETKNFKKGQDMLVQLVLVNWAWMNKKLEKEVKGFEYFKQSPKAVNSYIITGEILQILQSSYEDSFSAFVDCGFYVKLRILKNQNFKVGDFIWAKGRLDANLPENNEK